VFTSRCSVAASNGGRSTSSAFPNGPWPKLPASNRNSSQWLNLSSALKSLTHSLAHLPTTRHFTQLSKLTLTEWLLNFSWPSPAQRFLVPNPTGPITLFYCLTVLEDFRSPHSSHYHWISLTVLRKTSRHGPRRKHRSSVLVYGTLPSNGRCQIVSRSLANNESACHSIVEE
jgi:hypothetical protein